MKAIILLLLFVSGSVSANPEYTSMAYNGNLREFMVYGVMLLFLAVLYFVVNKLTEK